MATNEGVGKKIVEALKKQSSEDLEQNLEISETENIVSDDFNIEQNNEASIQGSLFADVQSGTDEISPYDEKFEIKEQPSFENSYLQEAASIEKENQRSNTAAQDWDFEKKQEFESSFNEVQSYNISNAKQFDMPANVSVLRKLITQLPTGVTKQTGAQIIKQTMEALGISMNSVLHDAQKVQDEMNDSIKNCMQKIQEYKNDIKNLEKQGLDYQRQVNQLNDLISLFILSDND